MDSNSYYVYLRQQELKSLIKKYPDRQKFQEEIERCLKKAGTAENRLAVLEIMLEAKLLELEKELLHISKLKKSNDLLSDK